MALHHERDDRRADSDASPTERRAADVGDDGWPGSFWVPKRRVASLVELADGTKLGGVLYADVQRIDGTPATIADRLEDPLVRFVPLASGDQLHLLQKTKIVSVELPDDDGQTPTAPHVVELRLVARLAQGRQLAGSLFAAPWPIRVRVSDVLNSSPHQFLRFFQEGRLVLVNRDYVLAITEGSVG